MNVTIPALQLQDEMVSILGLDPQCIGDMTLKMKPGEMPILDIMFHPTDDQIRKISKALVVIASNDNPNNSR